MWRCGAGRLMWHNKRFIQLSFCPIGSCGQQQAYRPLSTAQCALQQEQQHSFKCFKIKCLRTEGNGRHEGQLGWLGVASGGLEQAELCRALSSHVATAVVGHVLILVDREYRQVGQSAEPQIGLKFQLPYGYRSSIDCGHIFWY